MTVIVAGAFILFMSLGVFTGADLPKAIDDFTPMVIAFSLLAVGFDIGWGIREAAKTMLEGSGTVVESEEDTDG